MAGKVAEFVTVLRPNVFTLENVWGYRNSRSWAIIRDALYGAGYWLNVEHVNAADFGVPQTRKRMIVRAVLGGWVPYLPEPMPWVGWYAAIEDLIPTLPESKLAPWQLARLPDDLRASVLFSSNGNYESFGDHHADQDDPALSVTAQTLGRSRAVLVGGANRSKSFAEFARENRPTMPGVKHDESPSLAISATASGDMRAVLIDMVNSMRDATVLPSVTPSMTIAASWGERPSHMPFVVSCRVVAMTPRCLARFQSFPDWYELPEKKTLAAKGIGNAVPPLLYQRIAENMVQA